MNLMHTEKSPAKKKTVRDRKGIEYQLTHKIGSGGQGSVWQVQGGATAAKLLNSTHRGRREQLNHRLAFVRRLDLKGLSIAQPLETLAEPHCGYVMRFLRGMVPVTQLYQPGDSEIMSPSWYIQTGGLKRRLNLMAKLAYLLARIHSKGLIYGDISAENVFISESTEHDEVWLIDPDNLHYQSQASGSEHCTYTPGFGAPELVGATGCSSSLSDNYSFAVLCFKALSLVHPFLGDHVNEGDPELEEAAFTGKMPWIEDPEDSLNQTSHGVPREWILSPRLRMLFNQAFGPGRLEPTHRPSAQAWAEALATAANLTLQCANCSASFYLNRKECPYCQNPPLPYCQFHSLLWSPQNKGPYLTPKNKPKAMAQVVILENDQYQVTRQFAYGSIADSRDEAIADITFTGNRLKIMFPENPAKSIRLVQGGKVIPFSGLTTEIALASKRQSLEMHFGQDDEEHYYLVFGIKGTRS